MGVLEIDNKRQIWNNQLHPSHRRSTNAQSTQTHARTRTFNVIG